MASRHDRLTRSVAVIGLGRFGKSLALELMGEGAEVLGVDADPAVVQALSGRLTHVVCADSTQDEALHQLGISDFRKVVVGIGTDIEASILTTSVLVDAGIGDIWAKAISHSHARILGKVGAHHVVRPEHDMGKRVAHLIRGRMLDYIEFDDGYAMAKTNAPRWMWELSLGDSEARRKHDITVVAIKRRGEDFTYATAETVVRPGDVFIVSGTRDRVEAFSALD
ncbi:TrkA family potassium uptake protein [Nocardioides panacisoli]|uniref:potassium channel family protein n=1 Tax=Nocardioides panacisoli TaxID=627624 RepID=UPI001C634571|nr:TrkA family potassium uptake protein [Nocardioides panacisoli]QYJ03253.1 TrkA family potassium uptake protein [Nocardioides panacisoli]